MNSKGSGKTFLIFMFCVLAFIVVGVSQKRCRNVDCPKTTKVEIRSEQVFCPVCNRSYERGSDLRSAFLVAVLGTIGIFVLYGMSDTIDHFH